MHSHITVVPIDNLIIVDNIPLLFQFSAPDKLHALQWHNGQGHCEWTNRSNTTLTEADYPTVVAPYVTLWETEKARLEAEAEAAQLAAEAAYNSPEAQANRIRTERDTRLGATDYLMAQDYPLTDAEREPVRVYRQALRDITEQSGFPWGGEVNAVPWPELAHRQAAE